MQQPWSGWRCRWQRCCIELHSIVGSLWCFSKYRSWRRRNLKWDSLKGHPVTVQHVAFHHLCQTAVDVWKQMDFCAHTVSNGSPSQEHCPIGPQWKGGAGPFCLEPIWSCLLHDGELCIPSKSHCASLIEHGSELGYCLPTFGGPIEKWCSYSAALKLYKVRAEHREC